MKKALRQFAIFAVILLGIIYLLQYGICGLYKKRVTQKFTHIFNHTVDSEIMIFGSSVLYHGCDARMMKEVTGKSVYNMAWDGMYFIQYQGLIREFLSYTHNCKCIVISADFENLGFNGMITRPDLFMAYLNDNYVYNALKEIEPDRMMKARYVPGYTLTMMNKSFYSDIFLTRQINDSLLGFDPKSDAFDTEEHVKPFEPRISDTMFAKLQSCIADINRKGIKVVLVMTPVYSEGYKMILNLDKFTNRYRSLVSKDVYFLDYTVDTLSASRAYFTNFGHLNALGAARFTKELCNDLMKNIAQ